MLEQYVYKEHKKLRCGYTTGTCAAAAAKAAARMLFDKKPLKTVSLQTPKGIELQLDVLEPCIRKDSVSCAIKKDAGDDADYTDGILVYAECSLKPGEVAIDGGMGVGRVTKPGLEQPVGAAAINRVPREMILNAVESEMERAGYEGGMRIVISVPEGVKRAEKTFNPRLGIEGGISILGTSGIVEPMSEQALIDTIRAEMKVKLAGGERNLLVTPGNYGRDFAEKAFGIDLDTGLKCSNFIGETLDMACEMQVENVLLVGHVGKLVKIGAGVMNTHSKWADARMEALSACALLAGAEADLCRNILNCITTDDALTVLKDCGLLKPSMEQLMKKITWHLNRRVKECLRIEVIVFSNVYGVLAMSQGAEDFLKFFSAEEA